jgi:phage I-like protein
MKEDGRMRTICMLEAVSADELTDVKILYTGKFYHEMYGEFKVTDEHLTNAVYNFKHFNGSRKDADGRPALPVNYEHPSGHDTDPEKNKNSGLILSLKKKGGELWAKVWWTERAREYIEKKEYQWISPEFHDNWTDENKKEKGFTILGMALTNYPFLKKNQLAIALSDKDRLFLTSRGDNAQTEEKQMELETLLKAVRDALGLKDEDDIIEAIKGLKDSKVEQELTDKLKAVTTELTETKKSLKDASGGQDEQIKALSDTVDNLKELVKDGQEARKELSENKATSLVEKALAEGKITPAKKEQYHKIALETPKLFTELMEGAPKVIEFKESGGDGGAPESNDNALALAAGKEMSENKELNYQDAVTLAIRKNPVLGGEYEPQTKE